MTTISISKADDAPDVAGLVRRAAEGDRQAWERLVEQYARLIWSITAEFKLSESDAADVAQTTWLRCLSTSTGSSTRNGWAPGWRRPRETSACAAWRRARGSCSATTTSSSKRACATEPEIDERLLADERAQTVREALSRLPWRWQRLLEMLMADPPVSYAEISDQLGLPIGSIGPTRGRCLARLRVLLQAS